MKSRGSHVVGGAGAGGAAPIQWYPGHMARAMRKIGEYLATIDIVVEVVDARVARSGRNPMLHKLAAKRARLVVLNREDLAENSITKAWIAELAQRGTEAVAVDGRSPQSVARAGRAMQRLANERAGVARAIVIGVPNSGKSSIINGLLRRSAAKTEDRAGVTRQLQWFRLAPNVELMDTPGILVPKISDKEAQWKLGICGAVPRDRYDPEELVHAFVAWLRKRPPRRDVPDLDAFAAARGFKQRGGGIDYHTAARSYIRALGDGDFGRFSFESPDDAETA